MRALAGRDRIVKFMETLGDRAPREACVYFTGGACAVLLGWRDTTVDLDLEVFPDLDEVVRLFPTLKDELQINIELACPSHFIPELSGWTDRSSFIARKGRVTFRHYDFYSQALAKIERGHEQDQRDVECMFAQGLIDAARLLALFEDIVPNLYRYPAVDPAAFRRRLEAALAGR